MGHNRRQVLAAGIAALALPLFANVPVAQAQERSFAPPEGAMLYTRLLERSLAGGAHFTVRRSFTIRFYEEANGYRVEGEQVAVEVDAPESLASFAAMERERRETALFPLLLSREGLIESGGDAERAPKLDEAVQEVLRRIHELPLPEADQAEMKRFVQAVHSNASELLTTLPRDLFAPAGDRSTHTSRLLLPDGEEGVVTVGYVAEAEPETGLMRRARREVVTDIGGSQRRTLESWTLTPQA